MTRIALIVLTAVFIALQASASDCGHRVADDGASARTIVLAGGDAWALFRRFLAEIEQRDLDVALWKSKVQISRNRRIEIIELGWTLPFSRRSAEKEWERKLSGKRAGIDPLLLAAANSAGWDVVCKGPEKDTPNGLSPAAGEARVFFKGGMQYAARGDYANALKEFQAAEKISPNFDALAMNLGVTYLELKDYVHASTYLRRAVEQNPRNAEAHYNLACLQARLGQHEDALNSLSAAKSNGMKFTASVRRDPDFASLRGRADFETLFK